MCELTRAWAQFAPTLTPFVGLGALWFAWRQLSLNRANQRETTAKATFREFLKLAVENPELAEGSYQALIQQGKKDKYEWFVGYFLWAAEEILDYAEKDSTWEFNLQIVAKKHLDYFQSAELQAELPGYSKKIRALVEYVTKEKI